MAACSGSTGPQGATGAAGPQGPAGAASHRDAGPGGPAHPGPTANSGPDPAAAFATATPIKHVVVIFNENISFDHYFATYRSTLNLAGETSFTAVTGTPVANSL